MIPVHLQLDLKKCAKIAQVKSVDMIPVKEHVEEYTTEEMDADDIIVLKYDSNYGNEIEKQYSNNLLNGHFVIYYN